VVRVDGPVLLAIDGNSLVHRSYHALARTGAPTWAVRGLLTQLVAAVDRIRPVAVVVGFDDPSRSLRRDRWPQYKAQRLSKLDTLVAQLADAARVLAELGVAVVVPSGLEADDVLASASSFARAHGLRTVIATSDRDAFALIDETTTVLRIVNGGADASPIMSAERLVLLLGIRPAQYRDYAALRGDTSDNLPGVSGIGPRTAARLLAEFGSAAAAFDDLSAVDARLGAGVAARLRPPAARATWELNCQVMAMHGGLDLGLDVSAGPGVLPLPASQVDAVYRAHGLTWTCAQAVRVLADAEMVRPPRAAASLSALPWLDGWTGGGGRRLPKLPPRKPVLEQLSLFD
jgi:DNA polymerase-1